MRINFVEIQNFRKLRSTRIDFSRDKTLFVGANNSGKTSAMIALGHFLVDHRRFDCNDFTLSHWRALNRLGQSWEIAEKTPDFEKSLEDDWASVLPAMDVWLEVRRNEVHYISHLLPRLTWNQEPVGVRLRLEPKKLEDLYKDYTIARKASEETMSAAREGVGKPNFKVKLWPSNLQDFLQRRFHAHFMVRYYTLDPKKIEDPLYGRAQMQVMPSDREPMEGNPFAGLIRVDQIQAQRGLSDTTGSTAPSNDDGDEKRETGTSNRLSGQLRQYYTTHIDPKELPVPADVEALEAIFSAQKAFNDRLEHGFKGPFEELEGLGYPGLSNPKLRLTSKVEPTDGLRKSSALQYDVIPDWDDETVPCPTLPEQYNGLGYQNLISIAFRLMSFRDAWMRVGKADKPLDNAGATKIPPLQLVLVEEPEVHLHAQVQQVFIRRAYEFLRNHPDLKDSESLCTQLVVSTHSSHIVHEVDFASLRYFRRLPRMSRGDSPTTVVVNMSEVFGTNGKTAAFVTRYLRATHCDLFFADAAILVEGPAERILVPHFIRTHFPNLRTRYLTLLDIGGSHAHRFQPLIDHMGLTTLVITDLDSSRITSPKNRIKSTRTQRGHNQVTGNATLRYWLPKMKSVDELLDLPDSRKIIESDFNAVRAAYQVSVELAFSKGSKKEEYLPYTFEDALVAENIETFKTQKGAGLIREFRDSIKIATSIEQLAESFYEILRESDKAEFATNLIYAIEPKLLNTPTYIKNGLVWLEQRLNETDRESTTSPTASCASNPT